MYASAKYRNAPATCDRPGAWHHLREQGCETIISQMQPSFTQMMRAFSISGIIGHDVEWKMFPVWAGVGATGDSDRGQRKLLRDDEKPYGSGGLAMTLRLRACPRCLIGAVRRDRDQYGEYEVCLACGRYDYPKKGVKVWDIAKAALDWKVKHDDID